MDPLDEVKERVIPPAQLDLGTRHQAAVRFCSLNPGALALVASQDGTLSFCTRPLGKEEILLLRPYSMHVGVLR